MGTGSVGGWFPGSWKSELAAMVMSPHLPTFLIPAAGPIKAILPP